MNPGPKSREQLARLGMTWQQGEHVLITGPTGSGKSVLARHVVGQRERRQDSFIATFVAKWQPDATIGEEYKGWTRWKKWGRPNHATNRILLWPDVSKYKLPGDKVKHQQDVFRGAFNSLANVGKWTIVIDEGFYTVHPQFLNLGSDLARLHAMGRSAKLTLVTLAQRPSHLPLILYGSASHVFTGRTREASDVKRLAEIGGRESSRELIGRISGLDRHGFCWVPVAPGWPAETIDLAT